MIAYNKWLTCPFDSVIGLTRKVINSKNKTEQTKTFRPDYIRPLLYIGQNKILKFVRNWLYNVFLALL